MPKAEPIATARDVTLSEGDNASGSSRGASDFETAIAACGFGCFNISLIIVSMTAIISAIFATSSLAYIIPTAECDLQLNLMQKGALNGMSFAGMIISAIPWGFIADTMGRKKVLVGGLILDGIVVFASGTSQSVNQLLILKFFDGFLICGPFAVALSYVAEFHGTDHRLGIIMSTGMIVASATIVLPIMACAILPHHIQLEMQNFKFHTWHIFLMITAIVPLTGGILYAFFPESPRFLMSQGRNSEALECLKIIYALNKNKSKHTYPIIHLVDEDPVKTERQILRSSTEFRQAHKELSDKTNLAKEKFLEGLIQLKPMCSNPYFMLLLQTSSLQFCILLGFNSIRLWLPQIFATMVEFETKQIEEITICSVLQYNYNKTKFLSTGQNYRTCDMHINPKSYVDNIIVALASLCTSFLVILVINKLGNNNVLKISLVLSFASGVTMYFANSHLITLALACVFSSTTGVATTTVISISVHIFPTYMRTMIILIIMSLGRFGSLFGNFLIPFFISMGCIPPFVAIALLMAVSFILTFLLPNTNKIDLK